VKILIIDDQSAITETLYMFFVEKGYAVVTAEYGREGIDKFQSEAPDLVVLDIRLPDMNGMEVLKRIKDVRETTYVIMITAFHDMQTTIEAMKYGAFDYIHKPINMKELDVSIQKVAEALKARSRISHREHLADPKGAYNANTIVGESKAMQEVFKLIGLSCNNSATVLIQGESGTGKELIARTIHYNSRQKEAPFVVVNCGSIVETLVESELFGHERGAFTHAIQTRRGKIELAGSGTLFLDEIAELTLATQTKLLRFLQEKNFERVGGEKTLQSNARIIVATNRNLDRMVAEGKFREDLYFRLNVFTINVPPLKDRKSDIPFLVEHLLGKASDEAQHGKVYVSREALERLSEHSWPGNVRELENVITKAAILSREAIILEEHISSLLDRDDPPQKGSEKPFESLREIERLHVIRALAMTSGHLGKTCELLKITRPSLRKKMEAFNIQFPKKK
jgi:DNA-binding NtrC family response regulator